MKLCGLNFDTAKPQVVNCNFIIIIIIIIILVNLAYIHWNKTEYIRKNPKTRVGMVPA